MKFPVVAPSLTAGLLLGLVLNGASGAVVTVHEFLDFNSNLAPAGWAYSAPYGSNNLFVNGRWEARAVDGHGFLQRQLLTGGGTLTALRIEWDGNADYNYAGMGTGAYAVAGDGTTFRAVGQSIVSMPGYYEPTSPLRLTVQRDTGVSVLYNDLLLPRTGDMTVHYAAEFFDGSLTLSASQGTSLLGSVNLNLGTLLELSDLQSVAMTNAYTTGSGTAWIDNVSLTYSYQDSPAVPETGNVLAYLALLVMAGLAVRSRLPGVALSLRARDA